MFGRVDTKKSFYKSIHYCLEDKPNLTEQQKEELSRKDNLQHKDRAEVLYYNNCYGNTVELAEQYRDMAQLSRKTQKPVLHMSLRIAPEDKLSKDKWIDIGQKAAKEFGLENHQYLIVLHKDTPQEHIHIVGNRIGYDEKASDKEFSHHRMALLCRKLEKEYDLKHCPGPRRWQTAEEKLMEPHDGRKERLKEELQKVLKDCSTYPQFESEMKEKGYRVEKKRGIAFGEEENKWVWFTGSEVGYPLKTIEKILDENQLRLQQEEAKKLEIQKEEQEIRYRPSLRL